MAKERALRQIETEAADEMTAHWISANVSGARLDEMAVEWHWKLSALARQNKQINRSKGRRSDLAVILGSPEAIQQRTRENQELKKKIASALHHIEWLHWVVDGYSLEGASENYDPGGSCDQEILDEILRRASGVRRLPWEKESK